MMYDKPWLKSYAPEVPPTLAPYPDQPLHAFLERSAALYPDHPCTIFKGRTLTYGQMNALANRLANALMELGVRKGDPVGIFMPNTPQFVMAYYAILKAGGVVVAENPLYTPPELEFQLRDAGIRVALVMSNFYRRVKEVQPRTGLETIVVTGIKEQLPPVLALLFGLFREQKEGHRVDLAPGDLWLTDLLARASEAPPGVTVRGSDLALIQYSGGTTGVAKGAAIPHASLVANTLQMRRWLYDAQDARESVLLAIPLFHAYGMVAGMSIGVQGAATLVLVPDPRDTRDLLKTIHRFRPTAFVAVPTLYNAIAQYPQVRRYDLSSLRICVSGAAPLSAETRQAFETLIRSEIIEGYGLSEAPTVVTANPYRGRNRPGSIGLPLPDVECRIVSLEDGLTSVPPGELGELILRSPQVFQRYWNLPDATPDALRPDPEGGSPWLYTGDIVRMDEDGYFWIVDRKKEMVKAGGFQVLPREVEAVLLAHPKVQDASVAGVPDTYRGETVKAWVVLRPGQSATPEELRTFCAGQLARYKIPTEFEFRSELPISIVGKVLRRELVRQHVEDGAHSHSG